MPVNHFSCVIQEMCSRTLNSLHLPFYTRVAKHSDMIILLDTVIVEAVTIPSTDRAAADQTSCHAPSHPLPLLSSYPTRTLSNTELWHGTNRDTTQTSITRRRTVSSYTTLRFIVATGKNAKQCKESDLQCTRAHTKTRLNASYSAPTYYAQCQ